MISSRVSLVAISVAVLLAGCRAAPPGDRPLVVGRTERDWFDPTRPGWNGEDARPLRTTLWYPADAKARERPSVLGPPGLPFFRFGWVALDAAPAERHARLPLVVLSHGTGGSGKDLSWLAEWLAARGYLVAAVSHHGNSIAEDDLAPEGFFLWWERAQDLRLSIDRLLDDPIFGPRIDSTRIGAAGFSLGGHTVVLLGGARVDLEAYRAWCEGAAAVEANCSPPPEALALADRKIDWQEATTLASLARSDDSYHEPRVRAIYAIAPAVGNAMTPESLALVSVPMRVVVGEDDTLAPPDVNAAHIVRYARTASELRLPECDHYSFLSECGWAGRWFLGEVCAERPERPRAALHREVAADAHRFFEIHLSGSP